MYCPLKLCEVASVKVDSLEIDVSALIPDYMTPGSLISFHPIHPQTGSSIIVEEVWNENKPAGRLEETGTGSWRPGEPSSMPESSPSSPKRRKQIIPYTP